MTIGKCVLECEDRREPDYGRRKRDVSILLRTEEAQTGSRISGFLSSNLPRATRVRRRPLLCGYFNTGVCN